MENYPFLSISKYDFSPLLLFLAPKKRYCPQSYFFLNSYSGAKQLKFLQFQFCYHSDQFRSGIQLPYYTFFFLSLISNLGCFIWFFSSNSFSLSLLALFSRSSGLEDALDNRSAYLHYLMVVWYRRGWCPVVFGEWN